MCHVYQHVAISHNFVVILQFLTNCDQIVITFCDSVNKFMLQGFFVKSWKDGYIKQAKSLIDGIAKISADFKMLLLTFQLSRENVMDNAESENMILNVYFKSLMRKSVTTCCNRLDQKVFLQEQNLGADFQNNKF